MKPYGTGQSHLVSGLIFHPFSGRKPLETLLRHCLRLTHGIDLRMVVTGCRSVFPEESAGHPALFDGFT